MNWRALTDKTTLCSRRKTKTVIVCFCAKKIVQIVFHIKTSLGFLDCMKLLKKPPEGHCSSSRFKQNTISMYTSNIKQAEPLKLKLLKLCMFCLWKQFLSVSNLMTRHYSLKLSYKFRFSQNHSAFLFTFLRFLMFSLFISFLISFWRVHKHIIKISIWRLSHLTLFQR